MNLQSSIKIILILNKTLKKFKTKNKIIKYQLTKK